MKISVTEDVLKRFSGYRRVVVTAFGILNPPENPEIHCLLRSSEDLRRDDESLRSAPAEHPRINCWKKALAATGGEHQRVRSSIENLVLKVAGGNEIPFRSTVVAIANHISLKYLVPCGITDLDRITGNLTLCKALGSESFSGPEGTERPEPAEIILKDDEKVVLRRWVWRQDQATMVDELSRNIALHVDLLPEFPPEEEKDLVEELAALLSSHCKAETSVFRIDAKTPEVQIPAFERGRAKLDETAGRGLIKAIMERAGALITDTGDFASWNLWDFLYRGVIERIIVRDAFMRLFEEGKTIKIYQGFDATTPALHIGHLMGMRVLRWFQLKGHEVIFLVGDATGMVGDPSGKSKGRELLTEEQVLANMANWKEQAGRVLEFDSGSNPVRLLRNSTWLHQMTLKEFIPLMSKITTQRLLERDMFQERLSRGDPLFYIETIYPLLQGYDSVMMDVNAELGGSDQLYNMLVGRDLVKAYSNKEKHVLTTPLLPGSDGRKMGKTEGNAISLIDPPFAMFDGVMKVKDELILLYFRCLTDLSWSELAAVEEDIFEDPLAVKERLALDIVRQCHGEREAEEAHAEFIRVRREGGKPKDIPEVTLTRADHPEGKVWAPVLLTATQPAILNSRGEARRMIANRGVRMNDKVLESHDIDFPIEDLNGSVVRIGKNRFFKIRVA
ncbi:tyrosine--tRNA ligase [Acidobacteriota bacterium]